MSSFSDNFNRANVSPPSAGPDGPWLQKYGTFSISSNALAGPFGDGQILADKDLGSPNLHVTVKIGQIDTNDGGAGVCVRCDRTTGNGYIVGYKHGIDSWFIGKVTAGVFDYTAVASVNVALPALPVTVEVYVRSYSIKLYVNGVLTLDASDESIATGNYCGTISHANSTSATWDDFLAESVVLPSPRNLTPTARVKSDGNLELTFPEAVTFDIGQVTVYGTQIVGFTINRQLLTLNTAPVSGDGTTVHVYSFPGRAAYVNETLTYDMPQDFVVAVSDGAPNSAVTAHAVTNQATKTGEPAVRLARVWHEIITTDSREYEVVAWGFIGATTCGVDHVQVVVGDGHGHTISGTASSRTASPLDNWPVFRVTVSGHSTLNDGPVTVTAKAISNAGQGTAADTGRTFYNNVGGGLNSITGTVYWNPLAANDSGTGLTSGSPKKYCQSAVDVGVAQGWSYITVVGTTSTSYNFLTGHTSTPTAVLVTFQPSSGVRDDMRLVYEPGEGINPKINAQIRFVACILDVSAGGVDSAYCAGLQITPVMKSACLVEFGPGGNPSPYTTGTTVWGGPICEDIDCNGSLAGPCFSDLARYVRVRQPIGDITTGCSGAVINLVTIDRSKGRQIGTILYTAGDGAATCGFDGNNDGRVGNWTVTDPHGSLTTKVGSFAVTSINTGAKQFVFNGVDLTTYFHAGETMRIDFSTTAGVNGSYTVASISVSGGNSTVTVNETIASSTVGGAIGVVLWSTVVANINARSGWTAVLTTNAVPPGCMKPFTKDATVLKYVHVDSGPHSDLAQDFGAIAYTNTIREGLRETPYNDTDKVGVDQGEQIIWWDHSGPPSWSRCVIAGMSSPLMDARSAFHGVADTCLIAFCTFPFDDLNAINRSDSPLAPVNLFVVHNVFDSMQIEQTTTPVNKRVVTVGDVHFAVVLSYGAADVLGTLTTGPMSAELTVTTLPGVSTNPDAMVPKAGSQLLGRVFGMTGWPDARGTSRLASSPIGAFEISSTPVTNMDIPTQVGFAGAL